MLRCLGVDDELAHSSIRFGVGRFNTQEEIDYTVELVVTSVRRLRELSSATPTMRVSEETTTL